MQWCALLTAVKNYNKSLEKLQDFFFNTKTKCLRPKPRPRLSFLSSRRLETKTLVSRTTSLGNSEVTDRSVSLPRSLSDLQSWYARDTIFFRLISVLAATYNSDQIRHAIAQPMLRGCVFTRQSTLSNPRSGAQQRSQIWGIPSQSVDRLPCQIWPLYTRRYACTRRGRG